MTRRKSTSTPRIVRPWKHDYDTDRGFRGRVDRAIARGEYTPMGTQPNARDPEKTLRKRVALALAQRNGLKP